MREDVASYASGTAAAASTPTTAVVYFSQPLTDAQERDADSVGAPTWWGSPSWVMDDFLAGNDFANKRLCYFTTSASSSLGSDVLDGLAAAAPSSVWVDGTRFSAGFAEADVISWLDRLGL